MIPALTNIINSPFFWPACALLGFLGLLFVVSIWERRLTRPYVTSKPDPTTTIQGGSELCPPTEVLPEYVRIMSDELYAMGFLIDQVLVHAKTPMIQIIATVWFSPQQDILALSGAGTVLKMPSWQTWLFTPLRDGRVLVTTDNNDEGDHSGMYVAKRVIGAKLPQLLSAHRARMDKFGAQAAKFTERSAAEALFGIYRRRVDRMIERGIVRYIDAEHAHWRYNVWGGIRMCLGFFVQTAQTLPQFWRVKRKPVGSHLFLPLGQTVIDRYGRTSTQSVSNSRV